jgi:hypothetical protein
VQVVSHPRGPQAKAKSGYFMTPFHFIVNRNASRPGCSGTTYVKTLDQFDLNIQPSMAWISVRSVNRTLALRETSLSVPIFPEFSDIASLKFHRPLQLRRGRRLVVFLR